MTFSETYKLVSTTLLHFERIVFIFHKSLNQIVWVILFMLFFILFIFLPQIWDSMIPLSRIETKFPDGTFFDIGKCARFLYNSWNEKNGNLNLINCSVWAYFVWYFHYFVTMKLPSSTLLWNEILFLIGLRFALEFRALSISFNIFITFESTRTRLNNQYLIITES